MDTSIESEAIAYAMEIDVFMLRIICRGRSGICQSVYS
jgi:hypothetical protein